MIEVHDNPRLIDVWESMADHFLDTETRQDIPLTAMRCVEAGLSVAEARDVWRYEVSRAVGFNLCDIAGEWACWDREWLVKRIERLRRRWDNAPWTARTLRYYLRAGIMDGVWRAIARSMEVLMGFEGHETRVQAASDMAMLASHCFDFCPAALSALPDDALERLRSLFPDPFMRAMAPAFVTRDEERLARRRVEAALEGRRA